MEAATAKGAPSLWGPPNTLASFILQAFSCPAPWSPHYIPPGIRSTFISAGFSVRDPPFVASDGVPVGGLLGALKELLSDCNLETTDERYKSILSFGGYGRFEKPDLLELLACLILIALGPVSAQQLQLLIEKHVGDSGKLCTSRLLFHLRLLTRILFPLSAIFFLYLYLCVSGVSTPLLAAAALAIGAFLSLPCISPEVLCPLIAIFLVPCYAICFAANLYHVIGLQVLLCLFTKFSCPGTRGTISLRRLLGDRDVGTLRKGHYAPFAGHRAMQMIVTCSAILGVDFLTFPRRYCKSVNSGVTLMDLGVGGIIFTSGMVSRHAKGVRDKNEPVLLALRRAALQTGVLGIFGLLRFTFMSITNLHVSITEYGLHWNFYLTLMVVFVLGELVCAYSGHPYAAGACGFLLLLGYQITISALDLEEWMIEGPRTNFFSANREGIMGSIGFLSIFLLAVGVGHFFVSRAPSKEAERAEKERSKRMRLPAFISHLFLLSFGFLSFGLLLQEGLGLFARRRFVNLSWVAFVGGIEIFAVGLATVADAVSERVSPHWSLWGVNDNQLIIFLLANLFVGAVNMTVRSLLQPAVVVWGIMTAYMTLLFACGHHLGKFGRRIKLL